MAKSSRSYEIYFALEGVYHGNRELCDKLAVDDPEAAEKLREELGLTVENEEGGLAPDAGDEDIPDPVVINKTRFAHERWVKDTNNEIRMEKIYPLTGSIRKARNGGLYHRGNTHRWHPVWKKMDRRITRHEGKNICRKYEEDETILLMPSYNEDFDTDLQEFVPEERPIPDVEMPDDPGYQAYIIHLCGGEWENYYDYSYPVLSWDKCCRKVKEIHDKVESLQRSYEYDRARLWIYPGKIEDDELIEERHCLVEHHFFK